MSDELYSYHIFLFPFLWKPNKPVSNTQSSLEFFSDQLTRQTNRCVDTKTIPRFPISHRDKKWHHSPFRIKNIADYNEYNYFYNFVRKILYDEPVNDCSTEKDIEPFFKHFDYGVPDGAKYCIASDKQLFILDIEHIMLNVYTTGVAVLSFHLANRIEKQSDKNDILKINQLGRRIYPPFFSFNQQLIGSKYEKYAISTFGEQLKETQKTELANAIFLCLDTPCSQNITTIDFCEYWKIQQHLGTSNDNNKCSCKCHYEDFSAYTDIDNFKHTPFLLPAFIGNLFPQNLFSTNESNLNADFFIQPALDDRMFLVCWYGNDTLVTYKPEQNTYLNYMYKTKGGNITYNYEKNEWWNAFIFVDSKDPTWQHKGTLPELNNQHTYKRWADYGTLYGVSRYSFVSLTSNLKTLKNNNAAYLVQHTQSIYYKMAELCLVQRASISYFSNQITILSSLTEQKSNETRIAELYRQYIRFVNKIYFREITTQEQGIELYDLLQKQMRIAEQVKDLDNEIAELHSYVSLLEDEKRNKEAANLTKIATIFLPASLIAGILGMNTLPKIEDMSDYLIYRGSMSSQLIASLFLICVFTLIFYVCMSKHTSKINKK